MEWKTRRRPWRRNLLLAVMITGITISLFGLWATQNYLWRMPTSSNNLPPKAVLIDQLALNYPDPGFVTNLTEALASAGYHVDYWGPSLSAVDQFRQLPADSYDLIIIRSHIGSSQAIITTQQYSTAEYASDQTSQALVPAEVGNGPVYFALTAQFVRQDMIGRFPQSTVVIMGCSALQESQDLAAAFLDKGANSFIGWDRSVTIIHSDTSTLAFARQLSQGASVAEATRNAGGPDPVYGSRLIYLDWKGLVGERVNTLITQFSAWALLAGLLLLGPSTVFVAPRLLDMMDRAREKAVRHGKQEKRAGRRVE